MTDAVPRYEQELRDFLAPLGVDLDVQAVCFQLYRTSTDVIAAFEARALGPLGLSHTGFALMMTIRVGGPQEVRSLARKLRLSKPSVTSAIGTLERAGLVERERSTEDKRLVSVALTGEGRRLVRKALDALHRCGRRATPPGDRAAAEPARAGHRRRRPRGPGTHRSTARAAGRGRGARGASAPRDRARDGHQDRGRDGGADRAARGAGAGHERTRTNRAQQRPLPGGDGRGARAAAEARPRGGGIARRAGLTPP